MKVILLKETEAVPYQWYPWSELPNLEAVKRLRENLKYDTGKELYVRKNNKGTYSTYHHIRQQ